MNGCGHILTETGDFLITEDGRRLVTECFVFPAVTHATTCTITQIGHGWIWMETGMKALNPDNIIREAKRLGIASIEILD